MKIDGPSTGPINIAVTTTPAPATTGTFPAGVRRKGLYIQPIDQDIYWGHDNTVTDSTGHLIGKGNLLFLPFGETVDVYLVAKSGTVNVRVSEEG